MCSILNNNRYHLHDEPVTGPTHPKQPYDTCINLILNQGKSKDTTQLMEGYSVKNLEATPLERPQDREATATNADINEGDTRRFAGDTSSHPTTAATSVGTMAGLDEWLSQYMHEYITKQLANEKQKEVIEILFATQTENTEDEALVSA